MTEPTKAIAKLLWTDFAAMSKFSDRFSSAEECSSASAPLFSLEDIQRTLKAIQTVEFRERREFNGITVETFAAGHVLGACMFVVEIDGVRILYTGDYSREEDRHVPPAEIPPYGIDVIICESTWGIRNLEPRALRERRLIQTVLRIIRRGGKCLLPVFALGRVQEIIFILEEYWASNPEIAHVPIWYASPLCVKSVSVFEAYASMCGTAIKERSARGERPFEWRFVRRANSMESLQPLCGGSDEGSSSPCVVLAAPGMLQSGTSRYLFQKWSGDRRNGVILTGYAVKGTLADDLKKNPQLVLDNGRAVECSFDTLTFSAHADFSQTLLFLHSLNCDKVVLVHGEKNEMFRLRSKLREIQPNLKVFAPEILQTVSLKLPYNPNLVAVGLNEETTKGFIKNCFRDGIIAKLANKQLPVLLDRNECPELLGIKLLGEQQSQFQIPAAATPTFIKACQAVFESVRIMDDRTIVVERCVRAELLHGSGTTWLTVFLSAPGKNEFAQLVIQALWCVAQQSCFGASDAYRPEGFCGCCE